MRILNRLTKTIGRRTFVAAVGTIALVAFPSGMAWAQDYPTRPIHLVVPYPAGSSSDATARTYAPALAEILGQPVIVENVGGAAGQIGVNKVTKSPPDGYTLLHGASQNVAAVVGMRM